MKLWYFVFLKVCTETITQICLMLEAKFGDNPLTDHIILTFYQIHKRGTSCQSLQ